LGDKIENKENKRRNRWVTRHCCYGLRNSDTYTGLSVLQFMHLFPSIGSEPENLNYWRRSKMTETAPR